MNLERLVLDNQQPKTEHQSKRYSMLEELDPIGEALNSIEGGYLIDVKAIASTGNIKLISAVAKKLIDYAVEHKDDCDHQDWSGNFQLRNDQSGNFQRLKDAIQLYTALPEMMPDEQIEKVMVALSAFASVEAEFKSVVRRYERRHKLG